MITQYSELQHHMRYPPIEIKLIHPSYPNLQASQVPIFKCHSPCYWHDKPVHLKSH
jgi:hypothetical protein